MIKQFAGTTATRILTASLSFIALIMATRYLGAEQFGNISVFVVSIALIHLVAGIAGGPALIYFIPRMPLKMIFTASFLWSAVAHGIAWLIFMIFPIFSDGTSNHLIAVSFLIYFNNFSTSTLLARQKILWYNLMLISQSLLLVASLAVQFYFIPEADFQNYIYSLYLSVIIPAISGWIIIFPYFKGDHREPFWIGFLKMIKYGGLFQLTNGVQLLNYRLSYFLIDFFTGRAFLGVYAAGVQLSEGIWIFGKSFATVQYTSISNSNDKQYAKKITLQLLKVTFVITVVFLLILLLLPKNIYSFVFGDDFGAVKTVVVYMALGTLTLNLSQILSHYFSGLGMQIQNAIGSGIGLAITAISGVILIPFYGLEGAAITATLAYTSSFLWQFIVYGKLNALSIKDLYLTANEWGKLKKVWQLLAGK